MYVCFIQALITFTGQGDDTQGLPPKRISKRAAETEMQGAAATKATVARSHAPAVVPRVSIGYAGVRQTSFHRLLHFLMSAPAIAPALRLTSSSSFLDIGSGVGQCVLHAKLVSRASRCVGIEVVEARHQAACNLLKHVRTDGAATPSPADLIHLPTPYVSRFEVSATCAFPARS